MKIGFGSDHAAIELKRCLFEHMEARGFECVDYGAYSLDEKVDYPIPGRTVAEAIRRGDIDKGVLVCGTVLVSLLQRIKYLESVQVCAANRLLLK